MQINRQKAQPILKRMLIPMVLLTLIEVMLLSGTFIFGGAIQELDEIAKGIVQGKVANRSSYLQNEMINSWSNVSYTVQLINETAEKLDHDGTIDLDNIGKNSNACFPLVSEISGNLIEMLRSNKVTGAFVVFNNDDPKELREQESFSRPGVYFRDLDPDTSVSVRNSDLLIERGSVDLVHSLDIATDSAWKPQFVFTREHEETYNLFLNPQEQGYENPEAASLTELGYWGKPHTLTDDDKMMISYTVPLITGKGKVYGTLGMEITLDYLSTMLPSEELMEDKPASYLLIVQDAKTNEYRTVYSSDSSIAPDMEKLDVSQSSDGNF